MQSQPVSQEPAARFFFRVTARPRLTVVLSLLVILLCAGGLATIVKDTSVKAFIPPEHPSLVSDALAEEVFGLSDSLAVAIVVTDGGSVFEPARMELVRELTDRIEAMPNVRRERIASLATESSIRGVDGAVEVDPYISRGRIDDADARDAWRRFSAMTPHQDALASADGRAAIIMAELADAKLASDSYEAALAIAEEYRGDGLEIHVAGPGAVSGFLSTYIDRDARKMQPLVFALVLLFIYTAFRRRQAMLGPLLVIAGATGGAMGLMAWMGIPYYAITNALPVVLVAVSVADSIHILTAFYQRRTLHADAPVRELVIEAMVDMWRPITLTTITTIAGFVGISIMSIMPPIIMFGWIAALGVALAWVFSLVSLPNVLVLLDPKPSPAFKSWRHNQPSGIGRALAGIGAFSARNYVVVLSLFALVLVAVAVGASRLHIDRAQVDNFAPDEPIRIADTVINDTFAGSAFLDVIVQADEPEGLLDARRMRKIADLQAYFESLPHVQKTVAITDYLTLLHVAIEELPASAVAERVLPDSDDAIAQYLLVYEASGDPTDFEEEIDTEYRTAMIRGVLNEQHFSRNRDTVARLQSYIEREFSEPGMTAMLTGDVNVSYHWMRSLQRSHFGGVLISLMLVLVTSMLVFRSVSTAIVAVVPVSFTVLMLYAAMASFNIYLEPATSMFAAIAIGVGIDFAIHLIDKLREALALHDEDIFRAVDHALPLTARACYFNSGALAIGFGVLMTSELALLQRFGALVTLAAVCSYVLALSIVPALFAAGRAISVDTFRPVPRMAASMAALILLLSVGMVWSQGAFSQSDDVENNGGLDGAGVARRIAARDEGAASRRILDIVLTDRRGKTRERSALVLKMNDGAERATRFTYLEPKSVREVTFLSHDALDAAASDERWLYLPATRRVRRIPASDRGDYFLGTDFTYEDIQSEFKLSLDDYDFVLDETLKTAGGMRYRISGAPKTPAIGAELGYGGFRAVVNGESWLFNEVEFLDLDGELLKTVTINSAEAFDGIWCATDIEVVNHQTEHQTRFLYERVEFPATLPREAFEANALARGLAAQLQQ
ncbi:MAG: outer membrane lipoprotein-sorting protein [Halieaceae bacterium]|jgi:predicted RND superfamily exporter protein|nr:outer membrane lipoprotein-sorting protein [Halieaceae bacterium]